MSVPTSRPSIAQLREYVITAAGRQALVDPTVCLCSWMFRDGLFICVYCGTGVSATRSTAWKPQTK